MMPPQYQPQFQHIRHSTASASPTVPNGVFQQLPPRQHTPQPSGGSRPPSRGPSMTPQMAPQMAPRRSGSSLGPNAGQSANGYGYMSNPSIYNPQNGQKMPHGVPPHLQGQPQLQGPGPQYPNYGPPPPQHVQQIYCEEQRRSSMPPTFPNERPVTQSPKPQHQPPPPPTPQQHKPEEPDRRQSQQSSSSNLMPEPVKRMSIKSRSIFTPIDESRSILSQHWASSTSQTEPDLRSSIDAGAASRVKKEPPTPRTSSHKNRNVSHSSMSGAQTPPSRQNSQNMAGGKRPVLKVQIPDESEEEGSNTAGSGSPNSAAPKRTAADAHSGVVLPPPSPSASAIMSAGATGPPNPFARPAPPSHTNSNSSLSNAPTAPHLNTSNLAAPGATTGAGGGLMDTPVSALPSRFMTNEFLPSPSSFYPEWNFRGNDSNTLPSPLNFATPVVGTGPSFLREEERANTTNQSGEAGSGNGAGGSKRKTTPDYEDGKAEDARLKRLKH